MKIFEEYLNRHHISEHIAHHCQNASLVLKTSKPYWQERYALFKIKWENHSYRPGQYVIKILKPIHDGYLKDELFDEMIFVTKKWNQYEEFILNWCKQVKGVEPVYGNRQTVLAMWEMFVCVYDSWFSKQPNDIKRLLFNTLDPDKNLDYRYRSYQEIMEYLQASHFSVGRTWLFQFLNELAGDSYWLEKLFVDLN